MKPKYILPLIASVLCLFVGGILAFWIGAGELPWLIVGSLIFIIGSLGISQIIFETEKHTNLY